jgi:hypothetical protein
MPNEEARQAKALEGIERLMKNIDRGLTALNANFVAWATGTRASAPEKDTPIVPGRNYIVQPEGYAAGHPPMKDDE